ncbi:MAG: type IX secretion system sortase PorU [bacterium]
MGKPNIKYFKTTTITLLLSSFLFAYQTTIIQEEENSLILNISDSSKLEWRITGADPESVYSIHLGNADIVEISSSLYIPYWSVALALPASKAPTVRISNIKTEIIELDQPLTEKDIQVINSKPMSEIVDIGYFRFNPICELVIYPIRAINSEQISVVRSLDVSVVYSGQSVQKSTTVSQKKIETINRAFVNKKYFSKWQTSPRRSLAKPLSYPSGLWFRITVTDDGIYKIGHQELVSAGMNNQSIDINRIFLYSNGTGGREIDNTPGIDVLDNLLENSRSIDGGDDGKFDSGHAIVFYGRSSSGVDADNSGTLNFYRNAYSNVNYYWLLIADAAGSPKTMQTISASSAEADLSVLKYEKIERHELELTNFLRSGKAWYGEKFASSGANISVIFQIPEKADDDQDSFPAELSIKARGANNETTHSYKMYLNGATVPFATWSTSNWSVSSKQYDISLEPGSINIIKMNYTASNSSGQAHLDFLQIRYEAPLKPAGKKLDFWGPPSTGIIEYNLSDIGLDNPVIFDITDWNNVAILDTNQQTGDEIRFKTYNDETKRSHYLLTQPSKYLSPGKISLIEDPQWNTLRNTDISAQYVIITNEAFLNAAQDIAQLYSQDVKSADRLSTIIVFQNQILREFNADIVDPHAIRQFLTYAFNNWKINETIALKYVLLLGDGTFDYRHIESETGDLVMTYQVEETSGSGNAGFASYATDMRFSYINGNDKKMDLAIGRINARTASEAQAAVDKIRSYILEPIYGDWRSKITLVADDPERPLTNETYHINDTDNKIANYLPKTFNVKKLYLLEYPEIQDASSYGVKKPDATVDLLKQIEDGTVLINYFGHGSPTVWAQEYILEMNRDLGRINTGMKLPFWIAGTCSWGQFDDISGSCFPEALVLEPNDGGIAALAATRATYGTYNAAFVNSWIVNLLNNKTANRIRLGEVLQIISCTGSGINENNEKYVLFGDPALYLAMPYEQLTVDKLASDTLKTLSNIQLNGNVDSSNLSFQGSGLVKLFDSERSVTRYWVDKYNNQKSMSYTLPGEILFNGLVNFTAGEFSSRFFIPKDLNYAGSSGKITITGWNKETGSEIGGYYHPVFFAGSESVLDTTGPDIEIGFTNLSFKNGDVVSPGNEFEIAIRDPLGINIAGQMGHDISFVFDNNENQSYIATEYFTYDTNSDSSGTVLFQMPDLQAGEHSITVTAWDNGNNSSTITGIFKLLSSSDFALERVVNFPNPFAKTTYISFQLTNPATVVCTIYTVRGLKIRTLESNQIFLPGFNSLYWDGKDDFGDTVAKGIYIYKIKARSSESKEKDDYIGKMVKAG